MLETTQRFIILIFAILTLVTSCVLGEVVPLRLCDQTPKCTVSEVRVTPCPQVPCKLQRGKVGQIEMDITPNFSSNDLTAKAFWANGIIDIPFADLDPKACKYTTCPTHEGTKQTYSYGLEISKRYPFGTYDVKWKLTGDNGEECCALFKIKITR